ncbi:MAG: GNAT family N-acetyltransferase [Planctomycetes bacterium]|nr:GNAT family N-acetyltransferase [Planctomycetota bacterium]
MQDGGVNCAADNLLEADSRGDQPLIRTRRLLLRAFAAGDAPDVQRLAGEREVAATTLNIPHPYPPGAAEQWIATHRPRWQQGTLCCYAVVRLSDEILIGSVGLSIDPEDRLAELGYWIGKPYWGRGYATEAAEALVRFGFGGLGLTAIRARHMSRNLASGRVLAKLGMSHQAHGAKQVEKWGVPEDMEHYAIRVSEGSRNTVSATYQIDGEDFADLEGFYDVFERAVLGGRKWGRNIDALNDVLRGGFGTPDGGFTLVWRNSELSRKRLGSPWGVVGSDWAEKSTFEVLIEVIKAHGRGGDEAEDGVQLVLA